jgi:hypothetical protein
MRPLKPEPTDEELISAALQVKTMKPVVYRQNTHIEIPMGCPDCADSLKEILEQAKPSLERKLRIVQPVPFFSAETDEQRKNRDRFLKEHQIGPIIVYKRLQ